MRGFTLLEILVVVFIIAIIAGFAVLSIDGRAGADRLQTEAERLQALMQIAAEDAVLFGVEIGLDLTTDGYRFLRLEADGWTPIDGSQTPLRARALPADAELRLVQGEGQETRLPALRPRGGDESGDDRDGGPRPEVLFLSSGEVTPFELLLSAPAIAARYLYQGELGGEVTMHREMPAGA